MTVSPVQGVLTLVLTPVQPDVSTCDKSSQTERIKVGIVPCECDRTRRDTAQSLNRRLVTGLVRCSGSRLLLYVVTCQIYFQRALLKQVWC